MPELGPSWSWTSSKATKGNSGVSIENFIAVIIDIDGAVLDVVAVTLFFVFL